MEMEMFLEKEKARKIYKKELNLAKTAGKNLYCVEMSSLPVEQILQEMGKEAFQSCFKELEEFYTKLETELQKCSLPEDFTDEEYKKSMNHLGCVMSRANASFNWDNPILEYVCDEK